jgi:hypothetical protein
MKCRPELDSEEAWRAFLESADEQQCYDALHKVFTLAHSFAGEPKQRLLKFFEDGDAIYTRRFGSCWAPF